MTLCKECSTYSRIRARMEDFTILTDQALTGSKRFACLKNYPVVFMPTLVATAVPGGPVEKTTYAMIKADFLERLSALLPLDGLFLPMHGAMFVEGMQDGEGDWMESARKVVGPDCLLSASYDLHGNGDLFGARTSLVRLDAARVYFFRTAVHCPSARPSTFMRPVAESPSIQPASVASTGPGFPFGQVPVNDSST
jgi:microcystin degradation protein MlrC